MNLINPLLDLAICALYRGRLNFGHLGHFSRFWNRITVNFRHLYITALVFQKCTCPLGTIHITFRYLCYLSYCHCSNINLCETVYLANILYSKSSAFSAADRYDIFLMTLKQDVQLHHCIKHCQDLESTLWQISYLANIFYSKSLAFSPADCYLLLWWPCNRIFKLMSIIALLWGKWSVFLIQPMVYIRINTRNVHLIDNPPLRPEISVFLQPELKASLPQTLKQITVKYRAAQHHWHGTCTEVCISSSPLVILCILGTDLSTWIMSCFVIIYYSAI